MKWILSLTLLICLQVQAQESTTAAATPPAAAELAVSAPQTSESSSSLNTKNLKETEIPVNLEAAKKSTESQNPFLKALISLGIIAIMGCTAFYLIRKYRFKNPQSQATQIKILSQHYLGPKKSLAIVRVAGESVLIGVTDHNISMIKSLALLDEDIPEESPRDFTSVFSKKNVNEEVADEADEPRDDFSLTGIKDFVSVKLKNMRSLE